MLSKAVPDMAERKHGFERGSERLRMERGCGEDVTRRIRAGPRSWGRLTDKCWWRGCRPCRARLEVCML